MHYLPNQTYLDYIQSNMDEIRHYVQRPFNWKYNANGQVLPIISQAQQLSWDFELASQEIPEELNRDAVVDIFLKGELYKGTIAALLWGGAHKGAYTSFLETLALNNRGTIETRISDIQTYLNNGDTGLAYGMMMRGGSCYLAGVGPAFFTKLLYFLSCAEDANQHPLPLIYDSVSIRIHYLLLYESDNLDAIYHWSECGYLRYSAPEPFVYDNYIHLMDDLSRELDIDRADRLEAALFGWRTTRHHDMSNPRQVAKYLMQGAVPQNARI